MMNEQAIQKVIAALPAVRTWYEQDASDRHWRDHVMRPLIEAMDKAGIQSMAYGADPADEHDADLIEGGVLSPVEDRE